MLDALRSDLRYGIRQIWKSRLFTVTALLTLAVCIGANTAIFSSIYAVLLRPLPYPDSDRLVFMYNSYPQAGAELGSNSSADYFFRRERIEAFQALTAFQGSGHTIGEEGSPERVQGLRVTPEFLPLLGYSPIQGRNFLEEEMEPERGRVVILTEGLWRDRFDGDAGAVGGTIRIDAQTHTIVGVIGEEFSFIRSEQPRLLVPITFTPEQRTVESLHSNNMQMVARLAPGATLEVASDQVAALNDQLIDEWPLPNARQLLEDAGFHTRLYYLQDWLVRDFAPVLYLLWGGVLFVLVIGVVNIANLMLARSNTRMGELATRFVLGADRGRLLGQLVTESTLLALLGGAAGIGLGAIGIRFLSTLGADQIPRGTEIAVNAPVAGFALLLALLAGVLFGGIPMLQVSRTDLGSVVRDEGRTGTASRGSMLLRRVLVVAQVSIAFTLLIGAGLMFTSFRNVLEVDPGFEEERLLTGIVSLPGQEYDSPEAITSFHTRMLEAVEALPGVEYAGLANQLPFTGSNSASVVVPEGYEVRPGESLLAPRTNWVSHHLLQALGVPLEEGRYFQPADVAGSEQVMIVDRWLADRYWPGESAVGRRMYMGAPGMPEEDIQMMTIVGVVGEIEFDDLAAEQRYGAYYMPQEQNAFNFTFMAVRTSVDPASMTEAIRGTIAGLDPDLPFFAVQTMESLIDESLLTRRSPMLLLLVFAAVALFLAVVGIYGVLAYTVSQRTRELGIRMALGGSTSHLFRMVVREGLVLVVAGLLAGAALAAGLVRFLQSQLYGVSPMDPVVFGIVSGVLAFVALVACVLPALRASQVDPIIALNPE